MTSTHRICQAAHATKCPCGAQPGQPCACDTGHYHLARIAVACKDGTITPRELASVIYGDCFFGMDTVRDPEAAA